LANKITIKYKDQGLEEERKEKTSMNLYRASGEHEECEEDMKNGG
jgi:hypothetical protein